MPKITCAERDAILHETGQYDGWSVISGLTDLDGEFGEPKVDTTWEKNGRTVRDVRYPGAPGEPDAAPCEHYVGQLGDSDAEDDLRHSIAESANERKPRLGFA